MPLRPTSAATAWRNPVRSSTVVFLSDLVAACFADGGQDFGCYPFAEGFDFRFAGFKSGVIEPTFVDNRYILVSA